MTDVVYIVGRESRWDDKELLYSIRSVEKHLKNYRKIFVIGYKPYFLNDLVVHIPFEDIYVNKARNIMQKIKRAACDKRITGDFMLMNDDYFFLQPVDANNYPYYYKCDLAESIKINEHNLSYVGHLRATRRVLIDKGYPTKNFDTHYPIIYNKARFNRVVGKYNWAVPDGYIMRSIYCNTMGIAGEQREDCKINHPHILASWPRINQAREHFSVGDRSLNRSFEQYLFGLFPAKSRYEL